MVNFSIDRPEDGPAEATMAIDARERERRQKVIEFTVSLGALAAAGCCGLVGTLRVGVVAGLACGLFGGLIGMAGGLVGGVIWIYLLIRRNARKQKHMTNRDDQGGTS